MVLGEVIIWIGVYPSPLLKRMEPSVRHVIEIVKVPETPAKHASFSPRIESVEWADNHKLVIPEEEIW